MDEYKASHCNFNFSVIIPEYTYYNPLAKLRSLQNLKISPFILQVATSNIVIKDELVEKGIQGIDMGKQYYIFLCILQYLYPYLYIQIMLPPNFLLNYIDVTSFIVNI